MSVKNLVDINNYNFRFHLNSLLHCDNNQPTVMVLLLRILILFVNQTSIKVLYFCLLKLITFRNRIHVVLKVKTTRE